MAIPAIKSGPNVCTDCCSLMISSHVLGSRSYVSSLLIDTRVFAMGLGPMAAILAHTCWGYASTVVSLTDGPLMAIRAVRFWGVLFFRSMPSIFRELLRAASAQTATEIASLCASNAVLCFRMLLAMRVSLSASATATLYRCMRPEARASQSPKLKSAHRCGRIMMIFAA